MSSEKYKAWRHKNTEAKKRREVEEHRHMIKLLKREQARRTSLERSEKMKQGLHAAKSFIGKFAPPPQQLHPKPFSKVVKR